MIKETLSVNGLQIAHYITHPEKEKTIFFIHGNSSSSNNWRKQVVSGLLTNYRLITIDLPNHGNSGALDEGADFSLPHLGSIMANALRGLLNGHPYIVCGVSIATNIVAEMLACSIAPAGLIMAGPCIVGEGFGLDKMTLPGADPSPVFAENVPEATVMKYAGETSISTEGNDMDYFLKDYHAVQGAFRSSLFATIAAGNYSDQVALVKQFKYPVCIAFGAGEKVIDPSYLDAAGILLWNNKVHTIEGASHLVNVDAPAAFNALVAGYAAESFAAGK